MPSRGNAFTPATPAFSWNTPASIRLTWYTKPNRETAAPHHQPDRCPAEQEDPGEHQGRREQRQVEGEDEVLAVHREVGEELAGCTLRGCARNLQHSVRPDSFAGTCSWHSDKVVKGCAPYSATLIHEGRLPALLVGISKPGAN